MVKDKGPLISWDARWIRLLCATAILPLLEEGAAVLLLEAGAGMPLLEDGGAMLLLEAGA